MKYTFKGLYNLQLKALALVLSATTVLAEPEIGISFPPVASAEQRHFTIDALRPLGVTHIRFAENWRRRGMRPDFTPLLGRMTELRNAGHQILLTVQSDAPDAACAERNLHSCLIRENAPFEAYLQGLLVAIGDDIDAIQFGNEWDSQFVGSPEAFLELHQRFAEVVRRERPNLTLVLGGVTGRAAYAEAVCVKGHSVTLPDLDLTEIIDSFCVGDAVRNAEAIRSVEMMLANADYDVADIHLYDFEELWPAAFNWFANLTEGRPVWVTEFGGPVPSLEPQNPSYQAERLESYLRVINALPLFRAYYFKLVDDDGSVHNRSGLYDQLGSPKPALLVFERFLSQR